MKDYQREIVFARGEALAASLLASAAIRAILMIVPAPSRQQLLDSMAKSIDITLNMSGPGAGDGDDELNTQMRETARFQVDQHMHAFQQTLNNIPKGR